MDEFRQSPDVGIIDKDDPGWVPCEVQLARNKSCPVELLEKLARNDDPRNGSRKYIN